MEELGLAVCINTEIARDTPAGTADTDDKVVLSTQRLLSLPRQPGLSPSPPPPPAQRPAEDSSSSVPVGAVAGGVVAGVGAWLACRLPPVACLPLRSLLPRCP